MRIISLVMGAVLVFASFIAQADPPMFNDSMNYNCGMYQNGHGHGHGHGHAGRGMMGAGMFNNIKLSEQQHQKMRDIMRNRHSQRMGMNANSMSTLHNLITADQFNEAEVRKQLETVPKWQVDNRVEMAKMHHQMYQMLTPEQKAEIEKNYQEQLKLMQQHAAPEASSVDKVGE